MFDKKAVNKMKEMRRSRYAYQAEVAYDLLAERNKDLLTLRDALIDILEVSDRYEDSEWYEVLKIGNQALESVFGDIYG